MSQDTTLKVNQTEGLVFNRNLLKNALGEKNTANWVGYDDGAVARPVDGTGGTATGLTFSLNTAAPLFGDSSFSLAKDSSNRQGKGFATDFTIPAGLKFKPAKVKFTYRVTGTFDGGDSTSDSDLIVYLYRVSSTAKLIEPVPIRIDGAVPGQIYEQEFNFQFEDGVDYRLMLHVATTSTATWEIVFDDISVSAVYGAVGAVITPPQAYTPTLTNIGDATVVAAWERHGTRCKIKGVITIGATLPNATGMTISFPSGITPDLTNAVGATGNANEDICGWLRGEPAAAQSHLGSAIVSSGGTSFYPSGDDGQGQWTDTVPFTWATGDVINFELDFPVVGWGAQGTIGQDADTRVIAMTVGRTTTQSIPDNTTTTLDFSEDLLDTHGAYNTTSKIYTIQVAGWYEVSAQVDFASNGSGTRQIDLFLNGSVYRTIGFDGNPSAGDGSIVNGKYTNYYKSGDELNVNVIQNSGGSLNIANGGLQYNYINIKKVSGPSQIAASEKIEAKASGSVTTYNSSGQTIIWDSKEQDSHGLLDIANGEFTLPKSGTVYCSYSGAATAAAAAVTDVDSVVLQYNDGSGWTDYQRVAQFIHQTSSSITPTMHGGVSLPGAKAGWKIRLKAQASYGGSTFDSSGNNHWSIWML